MIDNDSEMDMICIVTIAPRIVLTDKEGKRTVFQTTGFYQYNILAEDVPEIVELIEKARDKYIQHDQPKRKARIKEGLKKK